MSLAKLANFSFEKNISAFRGLVLPKGTMTLWQAYLFYKEECKRQGIRAINETRFLWELNLSSKKLLQAKKILTKKGGRSVSVPTLTESQVRQFVIDFETAYTSPKPKPKPVVQVSRPVPQQEKPQVVAAPSEPEEWFTVAQARMFLRGCVESSSIPNLNTFSCYVSYKLIPSVQEGRLRKVAKSTIVEFAAKYPTGFIHKHLKFETDLTEDDLDPDEAYEFYKRIEKKRPLLKTTFNEYARYAIIRGCKRETSDPSAPVIGIPRFQIKKFVESRAGLRNATQKASQDVQDSSRRVVPATLLTIPEAYALYTKRTPKCFSQAWLRAFLLRESNTSVSILVSNLTPLGGSKRTLYVSRDEFLAFLDNTPIEEISRASIKTFSIEDAFNSLRAHLPEDLTFDQFERLVMKEHAIPSIRKGHSYFVRDEDVLNYFTEKPKVPNIEGYLDLEEAYNFYQKLSSSPILRILFRSKVQRGDIESQRIDNQYFVSKEVIEDFVALEGSPETENIFAGISEDKKPSPKVETGKVDSEPKSEPVQEPTPEPTVTLPTPKEEPKSLEIVLSFAKISGNIQDIVATLTAHGYEVKFTQ